MSESGSDQRSMMSKVDEEKLYFKKINSRYNDAGWIS